MPEYILLFRKLPSDTANAYADDPVTKDKEDYSLVRWQIDAHAFWRSSGDRLVPSSLVRCSQGSIQRQFKAFCDRHVYDYEAHVALGEEMTQLKDSSISKTFMSIPPSAGGAADVWDDITRIKTLNTTQSRRRQTMHVCPLQLDIVDRLINRYSNPGDLVLDPFGGLGTVAREAILAGRNGYTIELNDGYFRDAVGYLEAAEDEIDTPTLFDLMEGAI